MKRHLVAMIGLALTSPVSAQSAPAIRDSAGVRVVANTAPRSRTPLYHIDPAPALDLGAGGSDDELIAPLLAARRTNRRGYGGYGASVL